MQQQVIIDAVKQFNTPLYLYDARQIKNHYRELRKLISPQMDIFYSMKANPLLGICQLFQKENACCEVCSEAELHIALKAGFNPKNIIFVGPGKNTNELELCVKHQIYAVACESLGELRLLNHIASKYSVKCSVLLRINPPFSVMNAPLKMGGKATQFGFDLSLLHEQLEQILMHKNINILGIHVYNGTRILDADAVVKNTSHILHLAEELQKKWLFNFECIDIGGGLGIPYFKGETDIDIKAVFTGTSAAIDAYLIKYPGTRFILECGRFLIGKQGVLIAKVLSTKHSHQEEFVITDAGMNCHMAATGMGSFLRRNFPIDCILNHSEEASNRKVYNITGPLCTPGDVLATQIELPEVKNDDFIVIKNAGAYGSSASPGRFLSHGFPAEVLYDENEFYLLKRRETVEDILLTQYELRSKQ